jgi:hypothetical protein
VARVRSEAFLMPLRTMREGRPLQESPIDTVDAIQQSVTPTRRTQWSRSKAVFR